MKLLSSIRFDSLMLPILLFFSYNLPGASGSISGSWSFTSGVRKLHIQHPTSASFTSSVRKLNILHPLCGNFNVKLLFGKNILQYGRKCCRELQEGHFKKTIITIFYYYCEYLNLGQCHIKLGCQNTCNKERHFLYYI